MAYDLVNTGAGVGVAANQGSNDLDALLFTGKGYLNGPSLISGSTPRILAVAFQVLSGDYGTIAGQKPVDFSNDQGFLLNNGLQASPSVSGFVWNDDVSAVLTATPNDWHVVAFVWDGTAFRIYADNLGLIASTIATTTVNTAANLFVVGGSDEYYGGSWTLNGYIGDVVLLEGMSDPTAVLSALYDRWLGSDTTTLASYLATLGADVTAWLDPTSGITLTNGSITDWQATISSYTGEPLPPGPTPTPPVSGIRRRRMMV